MKFHRSDKYNIQSCGTGKTAPKKARIPRRMRIILEELGYNGENHRSQSISKELMSWADIVVTMANAHIKHVEANYPEHLSKLQKWYIDDPHFSSDPAVHRRVIDELRTHVQDHFC